MCKIVKLLFHLTPFLKVSLAELIQIMDVIGNWSISNFTIQSANNCAWGYANSWTGSWIPIPYGPEFYPDLFITILTKNSNFYYYSGYYADTWYPNSFSMYAGFLLHLLKLP